MRTDKKYWEEGVEKELESCKMKKDYVERANCIFDLLERITRVQDVVQLSIPAINESVGISQSMSELPYPKG